MSDIRDINSVREFKRITIIAGTVLNGVTLGVDSNFYSYMEEEESIIKCLETDLDVDAWDALLLGAKLVRLGDMDHEFDHWKEGGFEYPASSGNMFSLNDSARGYLGDLKNNADSLSYPMTYGGIGVSSVVLTSTTDVYTFYGAALTAHETERLTRQAPADAAIKAVTGDPVTGATIDLVFAINY